MGRGLRLISLGVLGTAAGIGAAAGAAIIGLSYMMGKSLQSQAMQTYAKVETEEYILSAILVAICLAIIVGRPEIINAIGGLNITDQAGIDAAVDNAFNFQLDKLASTFDGIARNTFRVTRAMAFNYNWMSPDPFSWFTASFSRSPSAGGAGLVTMLVTGGDSVGMLMMLVKAMKVAYFFLQFVSSTLLLPAGIALRFIPPARKVGGLLIGGALGVLVVFPAALMWTDALLENPNNRMFPTRPFDMVPESSGGVDMSIACSKPVAVGAMIGEILGPLIICLVACLPALIFGGFPLCFGTFTIQPQTDPNVVGCFPAVAKAWYWVKFALQLAGGAALYSNPLNLSSDEFLGKYYDVIVGTTPMQGAAGYAMQVALAIIAAYVILMIAVVIITKNLAAFFGSEGQFYGISKLV